MSEIKKLDRARLDKLQTLEKEMGCCLVALEPSPKLAAISDAQLKKIQAMEKKLDAVILAYDCKK